MTRLRSCCGILVSGMLVAAGLLCTDAGTGQTAADIQPSSPTYAIPLKDGNAAIVWWDAVSDPAHPVWRCEVLSPRGGEAVRTTTTLSAAAGDFRAALEEARAALKDRVAVGE